jgi:hypothetical protein
MRSTSYTAVSQNPRTGRAMERKRLLGYIAAPSSRRRPRVATARPPSSGLLDKVLREYGLLEVVVSQLCADDLLALALTSKALHGIIMPRTVCLKNLLSRLKCSGIGVKIREECHQKAPCSEAFNCTEYVHCGSTITKHETETKPCVTCKVATCDECRIHCVYQTSFEQSCDPDDPAELPNFSGYVLLQPFEQPILSPHHLPHTASTSEPKWQDPSKSGRGPYHDQGYLDVPLQWNESAPPEYIDDIVDLDLGRGLLASVSGSSHYTSPSPVVTSLDVVASSRKVYFCNTCYEDHAHAAVMEQQNESTSPLNWLTREPTIVTDKDCHCTLRARMLDRWLCVRCYQAEEEAIKRFPRGQSGFGTVKCCCGDEAQRVLCLWCWGEVHEQD